MNNHLRFNEWVTHFQLCKYHGNKAVLIKNSMNYYSFPLISIPCEFIALAQGTHHLCMPYIWWLFNSILEHLNRILYIGRRLFWIKLYCVRACTMIVVNQRLHNPVWNLFDDYNNSTSVLCSANLRLVYLISRRTHYFVWNFVWWTWKISEGTMLHETLFDKYNNVDTLLCVKRWTINRTILCVLVWAHWWCTLCCAVLFFSPIWRWWVPNKRIGEYMNAFNSH